jgi:Tfp pilus assembly protein PilN
LPDGSARVLAVFAHKDLVQSHMALLQKAGLEPRQIYLSTACLASAAIASKGPSEDRYALVNLSSGGVEAIVLNQGRLEYGRAVATVQDWSLADESQAEALHDLSMEVRASLSAYRRESEDGVGADVVYLCSDWADVTRPAAELGQETGREVAPAAFIDTLVVHGRNKLQALALVSLGAALMVQGRAPVAVNLVPASVRASRELAKVKRVGVRVALVAAVFLASLGLLYLQSVSQRRAYVDELNAAINQLTPRVEDIRSKQRNLTVLQNQVSREGSLLELLALACQAMPSQHINITHVNFRHGNHLGIAGRARDLRYIDSFTERLRQSGIPQLAQASQAYANVIQERSADVLQFAVTIPFPRPDTAEEEHE